MPQPRDYDFSANLAFSQRYSDDVVNIRRFFPGCLRVEPFRASGNDGGTDYVVHFSNGRQVRIDVKRRRRGCSQHWDSGEPDIALETWSVAPVGPETGVVGWTEDTSKNTDYNLFVFDPEDHEWCYLMPCDLLRRAWLNHKTYWASTYRTARQNSNRGRWSSENVFVPLRVVEAAMRFCSREKTTEHKKAEPAA